MIAYALTTVTRLKAFLGINVSTYDSILEVIINSVTDFIENECDRRFKQTANTGILLDGEGKTSMLLPQWPVKNGVTFTLYERSSVNYGDNTWRTISSDKYRVNEDSGIIKMNSNFREGFQNYKVDYTSGYAFENVTGTLVPLSDVGLSDLELVVWKLAGRAYNERKSSGNVASLRLYNYAVTYSKEAYSDDEIKQVLSKYTRLSF